MLKKNFETSTNLHGTAVQPVPQRFVRCTAVRLREPNLGPPRASCSASNHNPQPDARVCTWATRLGSCATRWMDGRARLATCSHRAESRKPCLCLPSPPRTRSRHAHSSIFLLLSPLDHDHLSHSACTGHASIRQRRTDAQQPFGQARATCVLTRLQPQQATPRDLHMPCGGAAAGHAPVRARAAGRSRSAGGWHLARPPRALHPAGQTWTAANNVSNAAYSLTQWPGLAAAWAAAAPSKEPRGRTCHRSHAASHAASAAPSGPPADPAARLPGSSPRPSPPPATAAGPVLDPARLVDALERLAAVGHTPEPSWLDLYLAAVQPALTQLSYEQLARLAGALVALRLEPPEPWQAALLSVSKPSPVAPPALVFCQTGRAAKQVSQRRAGVGVQCARSRDRGTRAVLRGTPAAAPFAAASRDSSLQPVPSTAHEGDSPPGRTCAPLRHARRKAGFPSSPQAADVLLPRSHVPPHEAAAAGVTAGAVARLLAAVPQLCTCVGWPCAPLCFAGRSTLPCVGSPSTSTTRASRSALARPSPPFGSHNARCCALMRRTVPPSSEWVAAALLRVRYTLPCGRPSPQRIQLHTKRLLPSPCTRSSTSTQLPNSACERLTAPSSPNPHADPAAGGRQPRRAGPGLRGGRCCCPGGPGPAPLGTSAGRPAYRHTAREGTSCCKAFRHSQLSGNREVSGCEAAGVVLPDRGT
jgi:hypothetical protein